MEKTKRNCWWCKFNKLSGNYFFGRCMKRKFKDRTNEISNTLVDKGCHFFKRHRWARKK